MKFELNHINKFALSVLLFVSIYHVCSLLLQGSYIVCFFFLCATIITGRALVNEQNITKNLFYSQYFYVLIASWLAVFLLSFSANDQLSTISIWFCILILCTSMLLKPNHAFRLNLVALTIYWFFSFFRANTTFIFIESAFALTIMFLVSSMIQKIIHELKTKLSIALETDILTGCIQPNAFKHELEQAVRLYNRYEIPFSLICLKYQSYFSTENDLQTWLKELTFLYQSRLRKTDILCRFTAQKFMVLLPCTNSKNADVLLLDLKNSTNAYQFSFKQHLAEAVKDPTLTFSTEIFTKNENFDEWFKQVQAQ